jgi:azurin
MQKPGSARLLFFGMPRGMPSHGAGSRWRLDPRQGGTHAPAQSFGFSYLRPWRYPMIRQALLLALLGLTATPLWAADCAATIEGNDAMQYNQKDITVPKTCKQFTVTLKHAGKLPKASMGHNWVLSTAADEQGVITDGMKAGTEQNYIKPDDTRVIAHTKLIGGGESDSATFLVSKLKAGETYAYFCSFPGHAALMKGTLTLQK